MSDAPPPIQPPEPDEPVPAPVSLMITLRQREELRGRGLSDDEIRRLTPAEAHARLGL